MSEFITHSREETALRRRWRDILCQGAHRLYRQGLAGKTAFCEGIAKGLGAPTRSAARPSPS